MATITCGSCNKSHSTVNEVKLCFTQNNNFVPENQTKAPAKSYKGIKTFDNKPDAEEFVKNTPNSKLKDGRKVKSTNVWNEDTESYQTVTTYTYTVVIY